MHPCHKLEAMVLPKKGALYSTLKQVQHLSNLKDAQENTSDAPENHFRLHNHSRQKKIRILKPSQSLATTITTPGAI
jgi:hypothetical protein